MSAYRWGGQHVHTPAKEITRARPQDTRAEWPVCLTLF
jgi:hypothetical protein